MNSGSSEPSWSHEQQATSEAVSEESRQPTAPEESRQATASEESQATVQVLEPAVLDHSYSTSASERHISSPLKKMAAKVRQLSYERKKLRQKLKRRDRRLQCLKSTLDALMESRVMDGNLVEVIRTRFQNPVVSELFTNEVVNCGRKKRGRRYSEEIKKLCLTIHYYSPRAYKFLARNFSLPGNTSLQEWTRSVGCEVGVLDEVLQTLSSQVAEKKIDPNCCLMVDEMAIRKAKVYSQPKDKFVAPLLLTLYSFTLWMSAIRLVVNVFVVKLVLASYLKHKACYIFQRHIKNNLMPFLLKK